MTRALAVRLTLTVIAVACSALVELRVTGVRPASVVPVDVQQAPNGAYIVHARSDLPLPPGLRDGDVLAAKEMTAAGRAAAEFNIAVPADTTLDFAVVRDGRVVQVPVTTRVVAPAPFKRFRNWVAALFVIPLLSVMTLLAIWRGHGRASVGLGTFAMYALVGSGLMNIVTGPSVSFWLNEAVYTGQFLVALPALYVMVEAFADSGLSTRLRLFMRSATVVLALAGMLTGLNPVAFTVFALTVPAALDTAQLAISAFAISIPLLTLLSGYRKADHESRLRIRWVLWSTALLLAMIVAMSAISEDRHPYAFQLVHSARWLVLLGYLYAALRNRLVDVSFVVNRAVLYAAITALLFGIFSLLELGLHELAVGDRLSWALQAIAALLLAMALSPLHRRLEHGLERILFRRQRQAIASLRGFAAECAFVEQERRLLEIAADKLIPHCEAVAIYERASSGFALRTSRGRSWPEMIDADDLAFVALRAQRREVDLHQLGSAMAPESLAFPMMIAEQLAGAIVCRPCAGERFAPDVRAALGELAHNLGTSLYILRYREQARLVTDIAAGRIDQSAARSRAMTMIANTG